MSEKLSPKTELKPKGLKGISDQQLEYHFEAHYRGYVAKINEVWERLQSVDRSKANQNFSEYRAPLKSGRRTLKPAGSPQEGGLS